MSLLPPTEVVATAITTGQIRVTWVNAQDTHGNNLIEVSPDAGSNWYTADATGGADAGTNGDAIAPDTTSYVVTGYDNGGVVSLAAATKYDVRVTAQNAAEVTQIEINDAAADLDGEYFDIEDDVGTVRVWFDLDAVSSAPAVPGGGRLLEVDVTTGNSSSVVATTANTVIDNDSKFACSRENSVLTIVDANAGARTDATAGTSGVTVSIATQGGSDSVAVTTTPLYSLPAGEGVYWAATSGATSWTHIISLSGQEPLITGIALGLEPDTRPGRSTVLDVSSWIWGPSIGATPTFPS